jgi:phosphohistidine phosphatase SixA
MFVLVRHADAGSKRLWKGPDAQRPLTEHGRHQAAGLAQSLLGLDIRAILTSAMTRCRQTIEPLATARQLPIREHELLLPDADLTALLALLAEPTIAGTVLCTHRETLSRILPQWPDAPRTDAPPRDKTAKGAAWIVDNLPGPHAELRYVPATPG